MKKLSLSRVRFGLVSLATLAAGLSADGAVRNYELVVDSVNRDRALLPLTAEVELDGAAGQAWSAELVAADGSVRIAQVEPVADGETSSVEIHWVEPRIAAGEAPQFELVLQSGSDAERADEAFHFEQGEGYRDLLYGDTGVYRYVTVYDPERHADTHKPYLQVYAFEGDSFITKGPGGRYPHHKGIFLGWNHTVLPDGSRYDFWHVPDEYQEHREFLRDQDVTGPVLARAVSTTDWKTSEGEAVVKDRREVTAWKLSDDELLLDFELTIESLAGDVHLGGDAHHAGFQFRAAQEVAENAEETTITAPKEARAGENGIWTQATWMAESFDIGGEPYTVFHLDHTGNNPKPTEYSTRDYGRFGAFITSPVRDGEPLVLKYRILVRQGRGPEVVSPEIGEALHADYVQPATVRVIAH